MDAIRRRLRQEARAFDYLEKVRHEVHSMSNTAGAQAMRGQTLGEYRVGIDFNPGKNPQVDAIKRAAADLIDLIMTIAGPGSNPGGRDHDGEVRRLQALAATHVEDAAMWAVKAVTKPPR